MYNSNFRHGSRAGLVALILVLFISLVSAVPIPMTESGLSKLSTSSSPSSLNGHPEADTAKNLLIARMSTPPIATRDLDISTDMDDQLVRREPRGTTSRIGSSFRKVGSLMKYAKGLGGSLRRASGGRGRRGAE